MTTNGDRVATLTFDGVPPPAQSAKLLDVLRTAGVPAAFFVTGSEAQERAEDVRAITASGHIVAGSGWSGTPLPSLSDQELHDEILRTNSLLEDLGDRPVRRVRPPHGAYDWRVVSALEAEGVEVWLWTTHPSPGPGGPTSDDVAQQVLDDLTPGSVIALDVRSAPRVEPSIGALPALIRRARRRGYEFVPLTYVPQTGAGVMPSAEGPSEKPPLTRSN